MTPLLLGGGFSSGSRLAFTVLAALALAFAVACGRREAAAALRSPPVLLLLLLAALCALSAVWSLAPPADVLRWAAVIAAYAALAVAAAVVGRSHRGLVALVAIVCGCAAIGAVTGLVGVALRDVPLAYRIEGAWRPAGTIEYPAALALMQVCALPGLLRAMGAGDRRLAAAAAFALAAAASVLALSGSRLELAMALAVLAAGLVVSRRRELTVRALLLVAASGTASWLALGGYAAPGESGGEPARLIAALGLPLLFALAWPRLRGLSGSPRPARPLPGKGLVIGAATALALLVVLSASQRPSGAAVEPGGGFDAGRSVQWRAALDVFGDQPLRGAGAESYLLASGRYQGDSPVLYAHDLPLEAGAELGVPGLLGVLALYAAVIGAVWKVRRRSAGWLLGPAALAFLFANLVDWPWHLAAAGALFSIAVGGALGAAPRRV